MTLFDHRRVPGIDAFERQLSQRFGIVSVDWEIKLIDSLKTTTDAAYSRTIGEFNVAKMPGTEITFEVEYDAAGKVSKAKALNPDGTQCEDVTAGFFLNEDFYPVRGWVAYSEHPYKDDLMAGIRIYCRGKIAAQTHIFDQKAGFTGEHNIRSYLIGDLHADWLDEEDDLIQTDRRDILWSHELGMSFQHWGQSIVKKIGKMSREPMKKKTWERFLEVSNLEAMIQETFPVVEQKAIRDKAYALTKMLGQTIREGEVEDPEHVNSLVQLSLMLAPHITLDEKLREAADYDTPVAVVTEILKTARIAELSSFGRIADDRIKVINKIETLKDSPETLESDFQDLITQAPWLINPQWAPISANQSFSTLKMEFQKYYKKNTGIDLILDDFSDPTKRVDFALSNQDNLIQIIEIKRPMHRLENEEMHRINTYIEQMQKFLEQKGNETFKNIFNDFHVTLVCDDIGLTGLAAAAYDGYLERGRLTLINWRSFLLKTKMAHQEFLNESERQKRLCKPS